MERVSRLVQAMRKRNELVRKRIFMLPWPPSVNHYWFSRGNRRYLSKRGYQYQADVTAAVWEVFSGRPTPMTAVVKVYIEAYPPDRRCRDIDNILKAPLDCLTKSGVIVDDEQIIDLHIKKLSVTRGGLLVVTVEAV